MHFPGAADPGLCIDQELMLPMSLIVTIAAPFRHTRKDRLKKNEIVYYLAFDRKWMSIEQANNILKRALDEGLVAYDGEMLAPGFDIATVDIPVGYKPSSAVFETHDPVSALIDRIVKGSGKSETDLVSEMNRVIAEDFDNLLMPEAAVVILARKYKTPFSDLLPDLKEHLLKK
ncbi:MAG TPA: DUF2240 family protein [Methanoregulaceae archaeon]|nr:DUF2240 family protein [Methanoregulaceae archaeon]